MGDEFGDTDTVYCRKVDKRRGDFPHCIDPDSDDCFNCVMGN